MAFMDSIDVSKPDGATEKVSNLDNRQRDHRAANKNTWAKEHYTTGEHMIPRGNTAGRPASPKTNQLYVNTQLNQLEQFNVTWQIVAQLNIDPFPATTRMIFDQDAAPTGWTKEVDVNDKVIRLVSGARADGGSWAVSGLTLGGATQPHTLVVAEIPSHTHTSSKGSGSGGGVSANVNADLVSDQTHTPASVGGDGAHSHNLGAAGSIASDSVWRPLHRDCIVCSKD